MEYAQEKVVIIFFMRAKKNIFGETDGDVEQCRGGGLGGAQYRRRLQVNPWEKLTFRLMAPEIVDGWRQIMKARYQKRDHSKLLKCTFILLNIFRVAELRQLANSTSWRTLIEKLTGLGKNFSFHKSFAVTIPKSQQIFKINESLCDEVWLDGHFLPWVFSRELNLILLCR